jgi:hypothetical protein
MVGYDFPGQIEVSDGSEDYGVIGTDFITLGNSVSTGSIRVDEQRRVRTRRGRKCEIY